jgi:hypothetical protein
MDTMSITKSKIMTQPAAHKLRNGLLILIAFDMLLIVGRVWSYPAFMRQPGAVPYVMAPLILLVVYAGVILAIAMNPGPARRAPLNPSLVFGLITGTMQAINIAIETFGHMSGLVNILITAPFLLGSFLLWGVSAFWTTRQTGSLRIGVAAAIGSGMIGILIGIAFGFLLTYTSLPTLAQNILGSPEQIASHWTDLQAFGIANTFDAGFVHLAAAWIIGAVVGIVGSLAGLLSLRTPQLRMTSQPKH